MCSPLRLTKIPGYNQRQNDIIYCRPANPQENSNKLVAFFGGDVQDFAENMLSHRDNKNYLQWNLESTAVLLHNHFPEYNVLVIRANRMNYKTFSCFDNFVPCNQSGAPDHVSSHNALDHLMALLENVSEKLRTQTNDQLLNALKTSHSALSLLNESDFNTEAQLEELQNWHRNNINLIECNLTLIGFSKGCVVLNQLLYEFHHLQNENGERLKKFIRNITDMYWLDGGHSGGKNTWITSKDLLETFAKMDINVHIHVTPYQIQDDRRPWIKKEEKQFGDVLRRLGATVERTVHFADSIPNLTQHFEIIRIFRT